MTMLRIKIERAKTVYIATAYPGDLAAELLPVQVRARTTNRLWWLGASGGSAVAAALVISFSVAIHNPDRLNMPAQHTLVPVVNIARLPGSVTYPGDSRYRMVDDVLAAPQPQYVPQRIPDFVIPQYSAIGQQSATRNSDYTPGGR